MSTLLFLFKNKNFRNSDSILYLLKDTWAFSSYSLNLKTANLKQTRISNWKFTSYGRELFVLISLQGAWRYLRLKISFEWFRLFFISLLHLWRMLHFIYTFVVYLSTIILYYQATINIPLHNNNIKRHYHILQ